MKAESHACSGEAGLRTGVALRRSARSRRSPVAARSAKNGGRHARVASRSRSLRRTAQVVSCAAGALAAFSQALPERIGPTRSRERFAEALFAGSQKETYHAPIFFKECEAQQRRCAQGLTRRHAQTTYWHRPRRSPHYPSACVRSSSQVRAADRSPAQLSPFS